MAWMMLPCLLILAFAIFAGGGGLRPWPFLLIIGIMVAGHLWMVFRGHGNKSYEEKHNDAVNGERPSPGSTSSVDEKKNHSDHSCCH